MILTYKDKRTEAFAQGRTVREFQGFAQQAYRRLEVLEAAGGLGSICNGEFVLNGRVVLGQ
jgi:proteic killer suppression protein